MTTTVNAIVNSKAALKELEWLNPPSKLESYSGTTFGRDIAGKIAEIAKSHQAYQICIYKQPAAVVMGVDEYEKLLSMKEMLAELLEQRTEQVVKQASDEFDDLLARIRSPRTRAAGDKFFGADEIDLASSFQPGRTEQS